MGRHNVNFEISIDDMELIENALRHSKSKLTESLTGMETPKEPCEGAQKMSTEIRRIHELLGRLHNQKVFYRPKRSPYISG